MSADSNAAVAAPLEELRRSPDARVAWVAASVRLPPDVADMLQQRGVAGGTVLLIAENPTQIRDGIDTPQFQLLGGSVSEAAALVSRTGYGAVVLNLESGSAEVLESLLGTIAPLLVPGALVLVTVPASARLDREAAHLLLLRSGYERVWAHSRHRASMLCVSACRAVERPHRTCSIIVPVYNEKETFPELMRSLLEKRLDHLGLEREIILVESNSTDGTRQLVEQFAGTRGVKILWQDRPRGKGNAVRAGMAVATGDIVLIQDADLEYDLNDYDVLLEPLVQGRVAFVLGSRHSGRVRMRRFTDQRLLGVLCDAAHVLFTGVINVLYGQHLKDPFTMFKVFRRVCLYGLQFECNRFDFDHELLIKLVLKGYRPLEIPVNYCSRSFKQGKKIRLFRDPPGWIAADLKFRLQRLRPRFD